MHLGLGGRERVDLTVTWPDGTERTLEDVPANQRVRLTRDGVETVVEYSNSCTSSVTNLAQSCGR